MEERGRVREHRFGHLAELHRGFQSRFPSTSISSEHPIRRSWGTETRGECTDRPFCTSSVKSTNIACPTESDIFESQTGLGCTLGAGSGEGYLGNDLEDLEEDALDEAFEVEAGSDLALVEGEAGAT